MNKESVEVFLIWVKWVIFNINIDYYDDFIFVVSLMCLLIRVIDFDYFKNKYERKLYMFSDIRYIGGICFEIFFYFVSFIMF